MCLLVAAFGVHPRYRLVVAANRDEFHGRPAAALAHWPEPAGLLAGRDLQAGGTWLGVDRVRRFGVITNFRELAPPRRSAPSRGRLIVDYLGDQLSAWDFANKIEAEAMGYAGFSLLLADADSLVYACNRAEQFARRLRPGIYGLSNHLLDTPWPKLLRVRAAVAHWAATASEDPGPLWTALADRVPPDDGDDPPELVTGLDPRWRRVIGAPFVQHPDYGTRCSTLSLFTDHGAVRVIERRFDAGAAPIGESVFDYAPGDWSA